MILAPSELSARTPDGRRNLFVQAGVGLWPGGVIPYVIDPSLSDSKVPDAIEHWEQSTVIRFVERTDERNWVHFTKAEEGPCRAHLGMIGGEQGVFLPRRCGQSFATVVHEIGHAVGLRHEQQRLDRDEYVWISPASERLHPSTFQKLGGAMMNTGPYDYGSVMHYTFTGPLQTIPRGISQGSNYGLTASDMEGVNRIYGKAPDKTTVDTNPPGLKIEVDGETYTAPHSFDWTPGTVHTIGVSPEPQFDRYSHRYGRIFRWGQSRYVFARWSDGGEQTHTVTASSENTIRIANFITQYKASASASPPHGGTVRFEPPAPDGFYTIYSIAKVFAEPSEGFSFERWESGSDSGTSANPAVGPISNAPVAVFTRKTLTRLDSNAPGARAIVDGNQVLLPVNFAWEPGGTHTVEVPEFFLGGRPTTRREFQGWSDDVKGTRQEFSLGLYSEFAFAREITASIQETTITASFIEHPWEIIEEASATPQLLFTMPSWTHVTYPGTIFTAPQGSNPPPQTLEIRNAGAGTLNYRISTDQPWLSVSPAAGSSDGETDTLQIRVQSAGLRQASFEGNIQIAAPPAAPVNIQVSLLVVQGQALDFTHFVNGAGASSDLVFVNSGLDSHNLAVYFYDTAGDLIPAESVVDVTGNLQLQDDGGLTLLTEIEPLTKFTISTHGRGELITGSVKVILAGLSGVMLRYKIPGVGEAVAEPSEGLRDVIFPVRRGEEGGVTTGVALHNLESTSELARCQLRSVRGLHGTITVPLPGNGQVSWTIESAFPAVDLDNFTGLLRCYATGNEWRFSAVALEMDRTHRTFFILPVTPVQRGRPGS